MIGDAIPDTDCVSRYCKPSAVEDGVILPSAFQFRDGEDYISVNWLEYLKAPSLESAVNMVRETFRRKGFSIRRQGRFAVLNVGDVKDAVRVVIANTPQIEHLPEDDDASHSGISGYSALNLVASDTWQIHGGSDSSLEYCAIVEVEAASRIARLVNRNNTYAGDI